MESGRVRWELRSNLSHYLWNPTDEDRSGVGEIHVRGTKVVGVDRTACRHIRLRSPLPTDESSWEETDEERIRAIVALAEE